MQQRYSTQSCKNIEIDKERQPDSPSSVRLANITLFGESLIAWIHLKCWILGAVRQGQYSLTYFKKVVVFGKYTSLYTMYPTSVSCYTSTVGHVANEIFLSTMSLTMITASFQWWEVWGPIYVCLLLIIRDRGQVMLECCCCWYIFICKIILLHVKVWAWCN